jgi:YbbR domain-containing protein
MSALNSKFGNMLKSKKFNVLGFFLILALLFSVLTKLSKKYTQTFAFQIEMKNVPKVDVILQDSSQQIDVTVSTYGFNLIAYYLKTPKLSLDFSNLERTKKAYIWTEKTDISNIASQFDRNVEILTIKPDSIHFRYDANFTKKVPVVLTSDIKFASGFDVIDHYILKPDSVEIIGPKVILDSINSIETDLLKLNNINSPITAELKLNVAKIQEFVNVSHESIVVKANIEKFTEGSVSVPVTVINIPKGLEIKYFPKEINVVFYTSLSGFNNISSNNFRIECDFSKLEESETTLKAVIVQEPRQVKNVRLNTRQIEFIIIE